MQGDANDDPDLETYIVGPSVLTPAVQIPMGGKVVSKLMEPAVAFPVLLSLLALLGVSLLDEEPRRVIRRTVDRVARRNPRLDELDRELAAVGVDVGQFEGFEEMDELDRALFALGIDVGHLDTKPSDQDPPPGEVTLPLEHDRRPEREPALTG